MSSLVHDLEARVHRSPDALALSWKSSTWTYSDLWRGIACVRDALCAGNFPAGARVAVLMRNSPQYAAAFFGTLAAGFVAVPLNVQERAGVLARQLAHSGCSAIVADPSHPEWHELEPICVAQGIRVHKVSLAEEATPVVGFCSQFQQAPGSGSDRIDTEALATLIYTSGTTGSPKGVMLSHRSLRANARAIADYLAIVPTEKVLCVLPFHFSYGASVLNSNLIAGAHLVIEDSLAFPRLTLQRMQDEGIAGFAGVPSTFSLLLGRCRLEEFDLSRLRYLTQAGGAMPRAHIEQLRSKLPRTRVFVMYGQTEATARLSYLDPDLLEAKLGSVGLPLPGIDIEIRSAEDAPVASGDTGEICAKGPNVMMGYWQDPELTALALRDGWLHTGDLGHCDTDGYLYIDGRVTEMIKVGAFRVSPQEVEEVLAAYPGVEEVAVTGIPDEMLGQAIKAVIVLAANGEADVMAIKAHCRQYLAAYKVPRSVEFAASLPRTASGKIQRFKLG